MNEQINRSYYAVIPANVRYNKSLSNISKLVYSELTTILTKDKKITVDAHKISKNLNIPYNNVLKAIVELNEAKIIRVENWEEDNFDIYFI
ncbi:hypothetical protein HMPREF9630_00580 [Peptoanaerobacter stomatis]|uniref:Uncharacterized protein n=1 Tax=Peptoanaerobacter stomatis TaxID=796937 RepID=V9HQX0_9FIRM|nr:hypothetical protein [Peptoanaerobacter stomatis]EHL17413.1 hypothetical protein HMPREF9630_00580 [Peptoanaerobacter stomatis]